MSSTGPNYCSTCGYPIYASFRSPCCSNNVIPPVSSTSTALSGYTTTGATTHYAQGETYQTQSAPPADTVGTMSQHPQAQLFGTQPYSTTWHPSQGQNAVVYTSNPSNSVNGNHVPGVSCRCGSQHVGVPCPWGLSSVGHRAFLPKTRKLARCSPFRDGY